MKYPESFEKSEDAPENPLELFGYWLAQAEKSEGPEHNYMSLATIDADGTPSVRIVLLKGYDENGFVFYTNRESRKGTALAANPVAALCFYWKNLGIQIRINGPVTQISAEEDDAYFATRPHGSQIGAWASQQSRPMKNRGELLKQAAKFEAKFLGKPIPRPPHWGGYRVLPAKIEFWRQGLFRLHSRVQYTRDGETWTRQMLYP